MGFIRDLRARNAEMDSETGAEHGASAAALEMVDGTIAQLEKWKGHFYNQSHYIEQVLGKALHYPELYPYASKEDDGTVSVGDHVPETLVQEAADRIRYLEDTLKLYRDELIAVARGLRLTVNDAVAHEHLLNGFISDHAAAIRNAKDGVFPIPEPEDFPFSQ